MGRPSKNDVLDLLLAHKAEFIRDFLQDHDLPRSGTKEVLRGRLSDAVDSRQLAVQDLLELLNTIEGWGNQQIYLMQAPTAASTTWAEEAHVRSVLQRKGATDLLNATLPTLLPKKPKLVSIQWSKTRLRFVWVANREWEERDEELDKENEDGSIVWKAYYVRSKRQVNTFDWNLTTGLAMAMLGSLPRSVDYESLHSDLIQKVSEFVDLSVFSTIQVSAAISSLEGSNEVRRRQLIHQTRLGGRARFTSRSQSRDTNQDPDLQNSRDALGPNTNAALGNFYWLPTSPHLPVELHTVIYSDAQRVGIRGQHPERVVRYVIGRLCVHSR